jgi:hypothetical protein
MYVPLRGVMEIRSLVFKQRSVSWDSFGVVGQISRTSFICPPMPATSHTQALAAIAFLGDRFTHIVSVGRNADKEELNTNDIASGKLTTSH